MTTPTPPSGLIESADGTPIAWWRTDPPRGASSEPGGPAPADSVGRPALILVHGATADHTAFRAVAPRFAERRRVISIDRRGRGASGDQLPYEIEREYEDVAALIDWLAAETGGPVDVVGHSFGGRCGLGAARLTANLRRLVVYEGAPAPAGRAFHDAALLRQLDRLAAEGDLDELMAVFMSQVVGLSAAEVEAYRRSPTWPIRAAAAPTAIRELRAEAGRDAAVERLAEVRIPVLQLIGGSSPAIFTAGTRQLDALLENGRVVSLVGQKHAAHHTDPAAFVASVEAFLTSALPSHHDRFDQRRPH
jgi:pimeloyl-ACP methyl ester carboxylesterase